MMRVPLSTTRRHTFGNPRTFACGAEFCTNMVAWDCAQALSRVSGIWNTWIPGYLHMILHKIICLAYFIRWAIPDLSPVLVVSSQVGQKDAGKRKLSSPPPPFPAPSPTINLVKRLELEDCLLLLAAAILGYVLSNPGEKTRHASFVQPPFNLASSLH